MRTGLTLLQSNLLDADVKTDVSWLFEVDATGDGSVDYYWSTKAKTWSGQAYTYKVMDFSPIRLERNRSEYGVSPPSTFSFTITNEDATLLTSDFSGGNVTVRCIVKADLSGKFAPTDVASTDVTEEAFTEIEGEIFTFNFDMMTVSAQYQTLSFECRDWFTKYLEGSYPNTSSLSYLWPSIENNGGTCVPVIYGTVYIPLYSAFITDDRYYILGAAGPTYTIIKSRSPVEVPTVTEWLPASYTFTPATKAGADGNNYRVFRLFGTTTSEEESSNVIYKLFGRTETVTRTVNLGTDYLSLPTKFSQTTTVSTTAPTDIVDSILQDMGVPSARIDATTKATCATTHTSWGLTWNVGLFNVEDRRTILARLLQNCHMELVVRDKIYFKIHSKTSQRDIERDMVIRGTFSYQGLVPERSNCGYVLYPHPSEDVPLNKLVKVLIPAKSTATIRSDYEVSCYYVPSSANAQTLGSLALQRKLLPSATISFSAKGKILQQEPDDVITIKPTDYGAPSGSSYPVLIDSFVIEKDLQVLVTATRFSAALDDWGDISPSTVTITTDTSEYAYSPIMAGPDSTGQTGTAIPNRVPGKFIVGDQTNYISFDPVIPLEAFVNNSVVRLKLGNIGTIAVPDYGIQIYDAAGTSIFKLDGTGGATGNLFCGWSLAANTITCASGVVGLNSAVTGGTDWRIWAGNATAASAPFRVDEDGNLVATSATITGSITATTGAIGGWTINATSITDAAGVVGMSSAVTGGDDIRFWAGDATPASAEFRVTEAGALTATSATITGAITANTGYIGGATGWVISTNYIKDVAGVVGLSAVVTGGDDIRFWAGHATPASAPFYVTEAGALTATSATITGLIKSSYIQTSSLYTKGGYLTSTCGAGDATLNVNDTTDFPASGSAWFMDSANDIDVFTYAGKTATTLTGCSGVLAHTVSASNKPIIMPPIKGIFISDASNEMRFTGDRGDGTIEIMAAIGIEAFGGDYVVGRFGSLNSDYIGVYGKSNSNPGIYGESDNGSGVYGKSTSGKGFYGTAASSEPTCYFTNTSTGDVVQAITASSGAGVYATSSSGYGVYGDSTTGWAGYFPHKLYCSGPLFVGDTLNAKTTLGMTINMAGNDDEIISLKSSDVAHGITDFTETDTFAVMAKSALTGGFVITGLTDQVGEGILLAGISTGEDTTTSTAGRSMTTLDAYVKSGTTKVEASSADANILVVKSGGNARFIVKKDGDIYYDGADQGTYDVYDDALACQDLSYNLSNQLGRVLRYNKGKLHDMGVISHTIHPSGKEDIFVSRKGMDMLQLGAIGELYRVCNKLCEKLGITFEEAKQWLN